jgi:acyl-CoA thioesterase-1
MSPWAAHFASGNVFFTGVALLVAAVAWSSLPVLRPSVRRRTLLFYPAVVLIAASATPLPYWFYGVWIAAAGTSFVLVRRAKPAGSQYPVRISAVSTISICAVAVLGELRTMFPPALPVSTGATVYVIGDSVSSGMNDAPQDTWPAVMGRRYSVPVVNLSQAGGTARSALRQAEQIGDGTAVVIVEIGGNDLLSGVGSHEFTTDLRRLLEETCQPGRRVLLMELPLPPFCNDYGRVQRELAAEFDCQLISKRTFVSVLAAPNGTVDSVHLSPVGHSLMAHRMWNCIAPVLGRGAGFGGVTPGGGTMPPGRTSPILDSPAPKRGDGARFHRRPRATDRRTRSARHHRPARAGRVPHGAARGVCAAGPASKGLRQSRAAD